VSDLQGPQLAAARQTIQAKVDSPFLRFSLAYSRPICNYH
jgi:hypothetical protein